ncbi:MAG TPA: hypothetical protein VFR41_03845 [Acidimicrobiia bacterium]|nr:hypothetical protein [Acidimicrobiia bacterium]
MSTISPSQVQIVPKTVNSAEVRLTLDGTVVNIGRVGVVNGLWFWQHRDGEQSSPVAESRGEAASLLANYHAAFKPAPVASAAPMRRLLFAS